MPPSAPEPRAQGAVPASREDRPQGTHNDAVCACYVCCVVGRQTTSFFSRARLYANAWVLGLTLMVPSQAVSSPPAVHDGHVDRVRVSVRLREGDNPWLDARPQEVPWYAAAHITVDSSDHRHRLHIVPRPDGFRVTYDRDGMRVVQDLDVVAGSTVLRGSDLGVELQVRIESVAPSATTTSPS